MIKCVAGSVDENLEAWFVFCSQRRTIYTDKSRWGARRQGVASLFFRYGKLLKQSFSQEVKRNDKKLLIISSIDGIGTKSKWDVRSDEKKQCNKALVKTRNDTKIE
jgi:hypothetical protein